MFKQNILDAQEFRCQDVLSCWQGILIWSDVAMRWHDHYLVLIIDDYVWPLVMDETFFPNIFHHSDILFMGLEYVFPTFSNLRWIYDWHVGRYASPIRSILPNRLSHRNGAIGPWGWSLSTESADRDHRHGDADGKNLRNTLGICQVLVMAPIFVDYFCWLLCICVVDVYTVYIFVCIYIYMYVYSMIICVCNCYIMIQCSAFERKSDLSVQFWWLYLAQSMGICGTTTLVSSHDVDDNCYLFCARLITQVFTSKWY